MVYKVLARTEDDREVVAYSVFWEDAEATKTYFDNAKNTVSAEIKEIDYPEYLRDMEKLKDREDYKIVEMHKDFFFRKSLVKKYGQIGVEKAEEAINEMSDEAKNFYKEMKDKGFIEAAAYEDKFYVDGIIGFEGVDKERLEKILCGVAREVEKSGHVTSQLNRAFSLVNKEYDRGKDIMKMLSQTEDEKDIEKAKCFIKNGYTSESLQAMLDESWDVYKPYAEKIIKLVKGFENVKEKGDKIKKTAEKEQEEEYEYEL